MRHLALIALALLALVPGASRGHSINPVERKLIFHGGSALLRFDALNAFDQAREFTVELYHDNQAKRPLNPELYVAKPKRFWIQPGESRGVTVQIKDSEEIKKNIWYCTTLVSDYPRGDRIFGVTTKVCGYAKFYRMSKPSMSGAA